MNGTGLAPAALLLQDAWVEDVLQVVPPARDRGPVRLELQTRQSVVSGRLERAMQAAPKADKSSLQQRAGRVTNQLNATITAPNLLSDTVGPSKFVAATKLVDEALGRMTDLAVEAEGLAEVENARGPERMRLAAAYQRMLEEQQAQSGRALEGGSPGKDEADARDAQNELHDALASTAFLVNLTPETAFLEAVQKADAALNKWSQATGGLKGRGDQGEADRAWQAITVERNALAEPMKHAGLGKPAQKLDGELEQAAQTLKAATDKSAAAKVVQQAAMAATGQRQRIEAAIGVFDQLEPKVLEASNGADATQKKVLQEAWKKAVTDAANALEGKTEGVTLLRGAEKVLQETVTLNSEAKALRERGATLQQKHGEAKSSLSADQLSGIGDVAALVQSLSDVTADKLEALKKSVGVAEEALTKAVEAREAYRQLHEKLTQQASGFAASKALAIDGKVLFTAAIGEAETLRKTKHEDGLKLLTALETNAAAFGEFCTTVAGFDVPLGVKGVRERVTDGLSKLDAKAALAAPATVPALQQTAAELQKPVLAWAAFCAVTLDVSPLQQVKDAEPLYKQKLEAAENEAKAGNVEAAGHAAAALKEWLAGVTQFAALGEKPRDDAEALKADKAISDMLGVEVKAFDQAKQASDFGVAGQKLALLNTVLKPAADLEAARKNAQEAYDRVEGTGTESKKADNEKKDAEFKKKLTDALTGLMADAKLLGERRGTLLGLLNQIKQIETNRQDALKTQLKGPLGDGKANAIFADDESKRLAMKLNAWLGTAAMQSMLTTIGDGSGGTAALTKAVKEVGALGKDTLAMLETQLADAGHIGKLCEPDGSVTFLKDLVAQFAGEEAKLGGLMQTGARGEVVRFKAMVDGKADRAKSIADTFDMKKLDALVQGCGGAATAKALFGLAEPNGDVSFVKKLADKFPGEEAKLGGLMKNGVGDDTERFKAVVDGKEDRAKAISDKFNGDLSKLRSLLKTGFSDDNATIKGVFDNGSVDQIKDLSDSFPQRTQLQRMTNAMSGAEAGEKIKKIATTNFGGDWKKLKQPFYDALVNAPDGNRLMRDADQFDKSGNIVPMPGNMGHFQSVDTGHISKRHTPENFNFNDIKGNNTQFAPTARKDLGTTIQDAITQVNSWRPGPPLPDSGPTWNNNMQKWYAPFSVTANGVNLLVGVRSWSSGGAWRYEVPQIFPTSGDNYNGTQMLALKQAMNR